MGDSERAVRKMEPSFRMRNVGFFYFFNVYFTFLHDDSEWKNLNQILLEVLMNCTKHFDLRSSLTASCVARFMICCVPIIFF